MIEIEKNSTKLILKYFSEYAPSNWIDKKLEQNTPFFVHHIFKVRRSILFQRVSDDFEEPEFYFIIGKLKDDYYKIDEKVLGLKNNFYFFKEIEISVRHFLVKPKINLLLKIDKYFKGDIYIGGKRKGALPYESFEDLISIFPNSYEINLYREAKVTSILRNYFDNIPDKETSYKNYVNKKTPVYSSHLRKTFKEVDIIKYKTILEKLKNMLSNEPQYSEKQWQEEIIQIILLLFPKYIAIFKEVRFKDIYNEKERRLDYAVIDFMGNLDLIEIKLPFDKSIVSVNSYRDNHIPNRDLSGSIMQIEKYIYYLNKTGIHGEKRLTKRYKEELPKNLTIKITNPKGIIIMGRDINLTRRQIADFEIIKRKYKNVIDIFTYDDLIRRMEVLLTQLKRI